MLRMGWLILLVWIGSCGVVRSPRNGYGLVRKCDRGCLAKYTPDAPLYPGNSNYTVLYEITGQAVRAFMSQPEAKTCVVVWQPWQKGARSKDLGFYDRLARNAHAEGVTFLLVSPYYDISSARKRKATYGYDGRLFVMDHEAYGKRPRARAHRLFVEDMLAGQRAEDSAARSASYLFVGDSLVYAGAVEGLLTAASFKKE